MSEACKAGQQYSEAAIQFINNDYKVKGGLSQSFDFAILQQDIFKASIDPSLLPALEKALERYRRSAI